jgi:hypothetical protein
MIGNIVAGIFPPRAPLTVTGGTLYTSGGYNYRVFNANGTLGVTGGSITADIFVVAGGGGGGSDLNGCGGGGGAGGIIGFSAQNLTGSYNVTIGGGGAGGTATTNAAAIGSPGADSVFGSLTAAVKGGAGSGQRNITNSNIDGGSGGGGSYPYAGGTGTSGQGNNGGSGSASYSNTGGGGGGAGGAGATVTSNTLGGAGGAGTNSITNYGSLTATFTATSTGVSGYIAGGGGGGGRGTNTAAAGGSGAGAHKAAIAKTGVWSIGVDADEYYFPSNASYNEIILTSMLKNVNVGVLDMINSMAKGTFKSGEKNFGLSNGGIGYSTAGGNIDAKTKARVDGLIKDIIAKKIVVPTKL